MLLDESIHTLYLLYIACRWYFPYLCSPQRPATRKNQSPHPPLSISTTNSILGGTEYHILCRACDILRLEDVNLFPDLAFCKRNVHDIIILDIVVGKDGRIRNRSLRHRRLASNDLIVVLLVLVGGGGGLDLRFDVQPHALGDDDVLAAHGEGNFGFDPTERVGGRGMDEEGLILPLDSNVAVVVFFCW